VTTLLLVRHAAHDLLGRALAGRADGVALNGQGRAQAGELVARLARHRIDAIYSSPRQRARETAGPLASVHGLPVEPCEAFDEIDFGEWTGLAFDRLRDEPAWRTWVDRRSMACPPGGEPFADVCSRALAGVGRIAQLHPRREVVVVSHGDVIKAVLAGVLGMPLDNLERLEIAPASLSILEAEGEWRQVRLVNDSPPAPA
jgi:broad specificity phosphatase PhoE